MALTEQETRLLSELVELREAYNDAGAFSTQDSIQMLQAALGLIYTKRRIAAPAPPVSPRDPEEDTSSMPAEDTASTPATQVNLIDSRVREVTVAIHLRIWDCLNRSEKLATQSLSVTAEIGYDRIYVGAARREKALFALRLLHNIMIPGTYNPDILPDIQHAFANGALVQGNAQSLLDAAIADQDLVAQLVYCRELLELNQKKLPEEDEAQDPRLTHFYEWLNRHPQHRQALSAFYHELDKTITLELKQTLIQAFDHLFHQYNSEPLSRFFSMPGTSNIQLCMEKYIVPVIQATREYYQPEPRKLRAQVQQRVRIDLTQKPLFGFLSPNKADRARRERSDDPPSTITGKKQRSIKNEVLEENLPPQPQ